MKRITLFATMILSVAVMVGCGGGDDAGTTDDAASNATVDANLVVFEVEGMT